MNACSRILLALALAASSAAATAQTLMPPTPIDLQAGYCLPEARRALDAARALVYPDGVRQHSDTLNRLGGYLIPKTASVDFTLIRAAMDRGEADVRLKTQRSAACDTACKIDQDCLSRCIDRALDARLEACVSAAFLPF